jgi:chromosome segregation ATPase
MSEIGKKVKHNSVKNHSLAKKCKDIKSRKQLGERIGTLGQLETSNHKDEMDALSKANKRLISQAKILDGNVQTLQDDVKLLQTDNTNMKLQTQKLQNDVKVLDSEKKALEHQFSLLQRENNLIHQRLRVFDKEMSLVYRLEERVNELEGNLSPQYRKRPKLTTNDLK